MAGLSEGRFDRYASLLLDFCVRLQPGQLLGVNGLIEHAPLIHAIAEQGYARGAKYVDIWYWDPHAKRSRIQHGDESSLGWVPLWLDARYEELGRLSGALITIVGDPQPNILGGLDEHRVGLDRMPASAARSRIQARGEVAWTIAPCPSAGWAEVVIGEPNVERFWTVMERILRLDEDDPLAAWESHLAGLRARAQFLNGLELDSLRFIGPTTDLTVGTIPGATWRVSETVDPAGKINVTNLPTEEVFTTPDWRRINGHVQSTRPLALGGSVVDGLHLTIEEGEIVDVQAERGRDVVRASQTTDIGAARIGEVALVDNSSRVFQSGNLFMETLLDENAGCHIAWGSGLRRVIRGWQSLSEDQMFEMGVNWSKVHVDFIIGGPNVTVLGNRRNGDVVTILANNKWQIAAERPTRADS